MNYFKLRTTFILLFISVSVVLFSQQKNNESAIKWGERQASISFGLYDDVDILKADSNFIYYYCKTKIGDDFTINNKLRYYLIKHNCKTNENVLLEIESNAKVDKYELLKYYFDKNTVHIFKSFNNKKDKKIFVFYETYDLEKFVLNDDITKISELDYSNYEGFKSNNVEVTVLHMNEKTVVNYIYNSNKVNLLQYEIFDNTLKMQWAKNSNFNLPTTGFFRIKQVLIDSKANLYILQQNVDEKKRIVKLELSLYTPDGKNQSIELNLDESKYLTAQQLIINEKDNLYCTGLYSKKGNTTAIGAFSLSIDRSLKSIVNKDSHEFTEEFVLRGIEDPTDLKNTKTEFIKGLDFDLGFEYTHVNYHLYKSGYFDLVFEKYHKVNQTNFSSMGPAISNSYYNYGDLLVIHCNADGKIEWVQKVPKQELLYNTGNLLGGYSLFYDKDESLNFIFNKIGKIKLLSANKSSKTVLVSIDQNGLEKTSDFINSSDIARQLMVNKSKVLNDSLYLILYNYFIDNRILSSKGNTLTIGTMQLK
jgi:hypothetical protein